MARVTVNEIKKMMEMEKDMTCVLDANNRLMKKSGEALEKHNTISEKQMTVLEKHTEVVKENTEMLKENTEVMKKYIELIGRQLKERKRSDRIRVPSSSSDIMEIPVPPPPPPQEPMNKRTKLEESNNKSFGWGQSLSNNIPVWQTPNEMSQPKLIDIPLSLSVFPNATPNGSQSQNLMVSHQRARNLFQSFEIKKASRICS
ncbi:hypothetical protein CRE_25511 [Caenorhabditis remanei]|uniref:Uncharacterized protein n=1 Tax=Caenorhabditis remanei TaxID=31234 RepID=E3LRZ6_CAERE|nr:hypothetical protein CRE_25511 [Caenorhabditis remanei]